MEAKINRGTGARWSVFLIGVWVFFFSLPTQAQKELEPLLQKLPGEAPSLRFENIGLEDGLNQITVNDIIQDKEGYLWISTQDGLHRYDGYEFKVYSYTPFDSTSISSSILYHIEESSDGNIWVTVEARGIQRLDTDTGKFTNYLHDPKNPASLSSDRTFDIKEGKNGDMWVSTTDAGLNHMPAGADGEFRHYRHKADDPASLTSDRIYYIIEDPAGMIWAGSSNGLNRVDPETGEVKRFLYDEKQEVIFGAGSVVDLYFPPESPGIVWLATGRGLVRLDTETGEHERFVIDEEDDPRFNRRNFLQRVIPDPSQPGILWVAGSGTGIARFDTSTGAYTTYRNDPGDPNSLGDDEITALFADHTGTIWAGHGTKGLSHFNPGAVNFSHLRNNPDDPESIGPGSVWGIYEDRYKNLWLGSYLASEGGYLTQINTQTGKISRDQHNPGNSSSLSSGIYHVMAEDGSGQFWVGGNQGLMKLDRESREVTHYIHEPRNENWARNYITALLPIAETKDQLWVGSGKGLDRFNSETGEFTAVPFTPGGIEEEVIVISLIRSREGILWIGTLENGLFRIDGSGNPEQAAFYNPGDTSSISSNYISVIHEREREPGILWLATIGAGLNRFDTQTGISRHYSQKDGLPNNTIYGILEDSNGSLWMSTNRGISNFDPEDGSFRNYGLDDGLMALEYNQFAFAKGADGMMYFGSPEGVTGFMPEQLAINEIPPQVLLSGLKLFNKAVTPGPGSLLQKPLSKTEKISLKYKQNEITIDFVALHYGNSSRNTYQYMLEGFDADWVDAGTRRSASYTNLPPGDYNFRVKAANADGIWSEQEASVVLSVLPPWYRTWWAYLLFALLLGVVILGVDRFQRKRLRKQEQERTALKEAEFRAEAENQRRADTEQLSNIGRAITSSLSITWIIDTVYEHVNELMDAAIFGIGIYNPEKKRLEFPATKEEGIMLRPYFHDLDEENRFAVWCFNNSKEIIMGDTPKESSKYINTYLPPVKGRSSKSLIYLPLIHQDRTIGVITTQSFQKNAFTPYHVNLLRNLATYAAIAMDNAFAYRKLDSTLSDLRQMQEQLVQQEKLASLGQLTAGIAHEIKNPLNFVNNFSELSIELVEETRAELKSLKDGDSGPNGNFVNISELLDDIENNLKKIYKHGTRADGIVRSMLQHSRGGSGSMEPMELNELIKEYVNLAFHGMRAGKNPINVEIVLELDEQAGKVSLIEEDFSRVIINLCNNAFEAMREKSLLPSLNGNYLPKLSVRTRSHEEYVSLEIEDNGPGIAEENRDKILQPFFTTKRGTEGTGLGLSITNDIIKVHGGELSIKSTTEHGSCFRIKLPQVQQVGRAQDLEIK